MRRPIILSAAAGTLTAAALLTAACGGSTSSSSSTTAPATTAPVTTAPATTGPATTVPAGAVTVVMGKPKEFSLVPSPRSVASGTVTFTVANRGTILHEMVVVPSPKGAQALKQADGTASEANSPGEAGDVRPGETKTVTLTLPPGRYTLLCNLPGHFAGGMYAGFTVS